MRGLGKRLISDILELKPKKVYFHVDHPKSVSCTIESPLGTARGLAICSTIDWFDEKTGRNKAAGRARAALVKRKDSYPIRDSFHLFPNTWDKRQICRVLGFSEESCKSVYLENHGG